MNKMSIKHKWDEALAIVNLLHACHDCCQSPGYKRLSPLSKMHFAHLSSMYVRLAPKVLVHKSPLRISYSATDAHALMALHVGIDVQVMVNEYTAFVLRTTTSTLDQAFS